MNFNISAFTHVGTYRKINQDRVLVNEHLLEEGKLFLHNQSYCNAFVADGVGGGNAGEHAANYILKTILHNSEKQTEHLKDILKVANIEFIAKNMNEPALSGAATTISGIVLKENFLEAIHAGDSEIWLLRNNIFLKISNDMVLDYKTENSPITSYFGGLTNNLEFDEAIHIDNTKENDVFFVCSDGLFNSLSTHLVKKILLADKSLEDKSDKILKNVLHFGAMDNVSAVIIECR